MSSQYFSLLALFGIRPLCTQVPSQGHLWSFHSSTFLESKAMRVFQSVVNEHVPVLALPLSPLTHSSLTSPYKPLNLDRHRYKNIPLCPRCNNGILTSALYYNFILHSSLDPTRRAMFTFRTHWDRVDLSICSSGKKSKRGRTGVRKFLFKVALTLRWGLAVRIRTDLAVHTIRLLCLLYFSGTWSFSLCRTVLAFKYIPVLI